MNILPICSNGVFASSDVFESASQCKMGKDNRCYSFCISPEFSKIVKCPFGYTVYRLNEIDVVYGVKVKGFYDRKKEINSFCPIFEKKKFDRIIRALSKKNISSPYETEFINSIFHEVRKLNKAIKSASEKIISGTKDKKELFQILNKAKNIFASSSLLSMRLNTYDFEVNPTKITGEKTVSVGVYQKFEKVTHILEEEALKKKLSIKMNGESRMKLEALPIFDLLPFVVVENAVKYSPREQEISIDFYENNGCVKIEVVNIGPTIVIQDISELFNKKKRGLYAQNADLTGSGYGLYLAKLICDLHEIEIHLKSSEPKFTLEGASYSDFCVQIIVGR